MGEATKGVRRRGEAGNALVLFALMLPVLLGFAALAVDVGYLYFVRTAMQATADASCLAGASGLLESEVESTARATAIGDRNIAQMTILGNSDQPTTLAVSFPSTDVISTTVSNPAMRLFFGRILGWTTAPVAATATCGLSGVNAVTGSNLIPLAVYCPMPSAPDPRVLQGVNIGVRTGGMNCPGRPWNDVDSGDNRSDDDFELRIGCGMKGDDPCAGEDFGSGEDGLQAVYFTRDWSAKDIGWHIEGVKNYTGTINFGDLLPVHGDQYGNFNGVLMHSIRRRILNDPVVVVPEVEYYTHQGNILSESRVIGFYVIKMKKLVKKQSQLFLTFDVIRHIVNSPDLSPIPVPAGSGSAAAPKLLS